MTQHLSPIFIGGTGRSGTTAMFRVLASRPEVVTASPELRVHIDPDGALNLVDALSVNWSPYQADIAIDRFLRLMRSCRRSGRLSRATAAFLGRFLGISPSRYSGMSLTSFIPGAIYDRQIEELVDSISIGRSHGYWAGTRPFRLRPYMYETQSLSRHEALKILGRFFDALYSSLAAEHHTHWCESSPYSLLHADLLLKMFPEAKFIHMVRNPMDVVASYSRVHWGGQNTQAICRRILAVYRRWATVRQEMPSDRYLEMRLEDVADEPAAASASLSNFLGFPGPEHFDMGQISARQVHRNRWLREISPEDQEHARALLGPAVAEYGYQ